MRFSVTGSASALLLAAHAHAPAQTPPADAAQVIQQVKVSGDAAARGATAAVVVRREELLRQGDMVLSEVLKRQPGVTVDTTPGKPAAIRMRGMGAGYAALLLDGLPAPSGFALESLGVDAIERIEILRAATAETSGQAVAGTINVVLRRPGKKAGASEVKAGSVLIAGRAAPQLAVEHGGRAGTLAYTLAGTLRRNRNPAAYRNTERGDAPMLARQTAVLDDQVEDVLELSPRLSWQPTPGDTLGAHLLLRKRRIDNTKRERETVQAGGASAFPHADSSYATQPLHAYADLAWTRRLDNGARLEAKLTGFHAARDAAFAYRGMDGSGRLRETHLVASGPREREWTFSGNWRFQLGSNHALAAGWELGRKTRSEYRRERQEDAGGGLLLASDEHYDARVGRSAFFVQDEWDMSPAWSAYLGLRREDLRTRGAGNAHAPVDVDAGAWSPILQLLFKPERDGDGPRDSLRLAVTRSYKAPNIVQLMPRRYTVDNNNSATNPDQQGNPSLRPELAQGVDVAWERSDGKRGSFSLGAFHKRIRDITLERVGLRDGVWVATPENRGSATVRGIEFEVRAARGALAARVNLARNWSRVDSLPGPANRIADQPAWSGNLGLDVTSGRVDLGGTWSLRGPIAYRTSAQLREDAGSRRQLDLYAVWKRDAGARLRLAVSDLLHPDYRDGSAYHGENTLVSTSVYRARTTWRLVWEQAL